jgi:hypothetical protein
MTTGRSFGTERASAAAARTVRDHWMLCRIERNLPLSGIVGFSASMRARPAFAVQV